MILQAARHVNEVLALQAIQDEIGQDVFWDLAEAENTLPFVNYKLTNAGRATKNGLCQYSVEILVYAKTLNKSAEIIDTIEEAISDSTYNWKFRGVEIGYNYSDGREGVAILTYEFKF